MRDLGRELGRAPAREREGMAADSSRRRGHGPAWRIRFSGLPIGTSGAPGHQMRLMLAPREAENQRRSKLGPGPPHPRGRIHDREVMMTRTAGPESACP